MLAFFKKHSDITSWIFLIIYLIGGLWFTVSVTSLYGVMGDDANNLTMWYAAGKQGDFLSLLKADFDGNIDRLHRFGSRYFPLFLQSTWVLGKVVTTIASYRFYLAANTFIDIIVLGLLLYRLEPKSDLWKIQLILSPLMLNLYEYSDGNALYSYHAFVQRTFLIMLIALHIQLSFIRESILWKRLALAALDVIIALAACLNYELGYLTIFPAAVLALYEPVKNDYGRLRRLAEIVLRVVPILIGTVIAFSLYMKSGGTDTHADTQMNLQFAFIALAFLRHLSSALPINTALLADMWIHPSMLTAGDIVFPIIGGVLILALFMLPIRTIARDRYWGGLLLGTAIAFPPVLLISLTKKFQNERIEPWAGWTGGWITSHLCTIGLMVIAATLILALRHYQVSISAGAARRAVAGLLLAAIFVLTGIYGHGVSRIYSRDGAYTYDFLRYSLVDGGLDGADDNEVIVSDFNVWGGDLDTQKNYFTTYSGRSIAAAYIADTEEANDGSPTWVYDMKRCEQTGKQPNTDESARVSPLDEDYQYIVLSGKYEDDGSYQLASPKVYIDTARMESYMTLRYQYSTGDDYIQLDLTRDELIAELGYDGIGFVSLPQGHVLPETISIYWEAESEETQTE